MDTRRWLALLFLGGCSAARPHPDEPPTVVVNGRQADVAEVQAPAAPAPRCLLSAPEADWYERAIPLRLRVDAEPFAHARRGAARMELGPSLKHGARAALSSGGVSLRGVVAPADVTLFLSRPTFLGGVVLPRAEMSLGWLRTGPGGRVTVRHVLDRAEAEQTLDDDVPCAVLSLAPAQYDAAEVARGGATALRTMMVVSSELAVAPSAQAEPAVVLKSTAEALVEVIAESGARRRIVWERDRNAVKGWVDASSLAEPREGMHADLIGEAYGYGGLGLRGIGEPPVVLRCEGEMAIFAEVAGGRRRVGEIRPGTEIRVGTEQDGWSEVYSLGDGFEPGQARLWVSGGGRCRRE